MKTRLFSIMSDIADIENRLAEGMIQFKFDKLSAVMGCGHPADIMDVIISPVGDAVYFGKDVSKDNLKELITNLKEFADNFEIDELSQPIKRLEAYYAEL